VNRGRVDFRDVDGAFSERYRFRAGIEPYVARQNDSRSASGNVNRSGLVVKYYH
jgi:hypothetical protein